MNNPSSPTPPPSPESLPSSSDDYHDSPRENIPELSAVSASVSHSSLGTPPFSPSLSSSVTNASMEPTSSTNCSSIPLMGSQNGFVLNNNDEPVAAGSSNPRHDGISDSYSNSLDQSPSSSRSKSDSLMKFRSSCSPNHFSAEVTSSDMDVDMTHITSDDNSNSLDNEVGYLWAPDSSEGAAGCSFSHNGQELPPSAVGETMVSRSTWHVKCTKNNLNPETLSSEWSLDPYASSASDVSSTGPPDPNKSNERNGSSSKWLSEDPNNLTGDSSASGSSCSRDAVNSSLDEESAPSSWCPESTEGAVGMSWQCDSPNSAVAGPSISPSSSSTSLGASLSLSPWPPPLSSTSSATASSISSSSQHYSTNPNINSTSATHGDVTPQTLSWRTRASSSPISLTRVAPTTPPPRPPTPPCPASRTRPVPHSSRRSVSPQDRLHSPSSLRRSVSPPLHHHSRSTPPTPSRRSVSPPLRGRGLSQRLASPRRSESPISLHQSLAQPPSPSGRHRLSPRPRSARTPSPRPPRPPNSTPEPSPSPSQHSPRPHHAKMRGR